MNGDIARRKGFALVGAAVEKDGRALHITAVAAGLGGYVGKHRKRKDLVADVPAPGYDDVSLSKYQ